MDLDACDLQIHVQALGLCGSILYHVDICIVDIHGTAHCLNGLWFWLMYNLLYHKHECMAALLHCASICC